MRDASAGASVRSLATSAGKANPSRAKLVAGVERGQGEAARLVALDHEPARSASDRRPCREVGLRRLAERRARVDVRAGLVGRRPEERERAGIVRVDDAEPPAAWRAAHRHRRDLAPLRPASCTRDREAYVREAAEAGGRVPAADSRRDRLLRSDAAAGRGGRAGRASRCTTSPTVNATRRTSRGPSSVTTGGLPDEIAVAGTARSSGWNVPEKCAAARVDDDACSPATAARSRSRTRRGRRCAGPGAALVTW